MIGRQGEKLKNIELTTATKVSMTVRVGEEGGKDVCTRVSRRHSGREEGILITEGCGSMG